MPRASHLALFRWRIYAAYAISSIIISVTATPITEFYTPHESVKGWACSDVLNNISTNTHGQLVICGEVWTAPSLGGEYATMGPLFTVFNSRELATATNIYTPAPPALNPDYIRHDEPLHTEWALTELDHGIFVAAYLAIVAGIAWYTIGRFFIREPKRDIS